MFDLARDLSVALLPNYRGFLGSCRFIQLAIGKDVFELQANIVY